MNPSAVPIPDNLKPGDIIHTNNGKECLFTEYRNSWALTNWLSFLRTTGYADPTDIHCVRVQYKSLSKYPSNYALGKASS